MKWLISSLRWCYRLFWYTVAILVILLAIAISLVRTFIPDVKEYREEIEFFASTVLEQEVHIDSMDARMAGFSPLIIFNGVRMMDNKGQKELIRFDQARLTIDPLRSIANLKVIPKAFIIHGVSIGIKRKPDGTFSIQGVDVDELGKQFSFKQEDVTNASDDLADWFFKRSDLAIKNSTVFWQDSLSKDRVTRYQNVNFYIRNDGDRHQLTGTVTLPPELGQNLEVAFDFNGNILNPAEWYGKFYTNGKSINVGNWGEKLHLRGAILDSGNVDLQLWGNWQAGIVTSLTTDFMARAVRFKVNHEKEDVLVNQLGGRLDWTKKANGWALNITGLEYEGGSGAWPKTDVSVQFQLDDQSHYRIDAFTGFLRLQDVREILRYGKWFDTELQDRFFQLSPEGEVRNLRVKSSNQGKTPEYYIKADMTGINVSASGKFPGVKNLSGAIEADQHRGFLTLQSIDTELSLPTLFRGPIEIGKADARLAWWKQNRQWFVTTRDASLSNKDIEAGLSGLFVLPEDQGSPYLDLQVAFKNGQAVSTARYLPVSIMDDELVTWLDNAFKSGTINHGGFVFNGRLKEFPFKQYQGTMLADFSVSQVKLNYQPHWPPLLANTGNVTITGLGLSIEVPRASMFNSKLLRTHIDIAAFATPYLKIRGRFKGKTDDAIRYLVDTPIADDAAGIYRQAKISGQVGGQLSLQIPLSERARAKHPFTYKGFVDISDSQLNVWKNRLAVEKLNGRIDFSPKRIASKNLTARVFGGETKLRLFSQFTNDYDELKLSLQGKALMSQINEHIPHPLLSKISGQSDWQGILSMGRQWRNGTTQAGYFQFSSRLEGIASQLPAPLDKPAEIAKPISVRVEFPHDDILPIYADYSTDWSAALAINLRETDAHVIERGSINFLDKKAVLPDKHSLVIKGWIPVFPIDEWQAMLSASRAKKGFDVVSPDLPVVLDLDYLKLETHDNPQADDRKAGLDPREIPLISGEIRNFNYANTKFGKVSFDMLRHPEGVLLSDLVADGPYMKLKGEASWLQRSERQQTNMLFTLASDDVGTLLENLGYAVTIRKGKLQSVVQAYWYDAPNKFELGKLNGSVAAVIDDGVINDIKPGAGRLLGLLSLSELPRRLKLDFNEFRSGLAFSQIVGQVEIQNGVANTDTLKIISPVALISIDGSTDLATEKFDQTVHVVPNVSGSVPIVSWLAWGGQVGVLAFILDQLFGDTFNSSVGTEYLVTGTWENPIIKKIELPTADGGTATDLDVHDE